MSKMVMYYNDLEIKSPFIQDKLPIFVSMFLILLPVLVYMSRLNQTFFYTTLIGAGVVALLQLVAIKNNILKYPL